MQSRRFMMAALPSKTNRKPIPTPLPACLFLPSAPASETCHPRLLYFRLIAPRSLGNKSPLIVRGVRQSPGMRERRSGGDSLVARKAAGPGFPVREPKNSAGSSCICLCRCRPPIIGHVDDNREQRPDSAGPCSDAANDTLLEPTKQLETVPFEFSCPVLRVGDHPVSLYRGAGLRLSEESATDHEFLRHWTGYDLGGSPQVPEVGFSASRASPVCGHRLCRRLPSAAHSVASRRLLCVGKFPGCLKSRNSPAIPLGNSEYPRVGRRFFPGAGWEFWGGPGGALGPSAVTDLSSPEPWLELGSSRFCFTSACPGCLGFFWVFLFFFLLSGEAGWHGGFYAHGGCDFAY